jgi:PAS domain S-box-containing protein
LQRLVIERSHDLVTLIEPDGTIVYASPRWATMLGFQPEEVVGTSLLDYCHPDDAVAGLGAIERFSSGEQLPSVVTRRATKDGRWLTVESNATPIFDSQGNVTHILGSARDITEREELRLGLAEIDALYRIADAIAQTTSLDELFEEAIDTLVSVTSADRASVLLVDETSVMRFAAWRNLSAAYREATDGHSPWTADVVDPQPVLVPDVAAAAFEQELERAVLGEGIGALAFIPLLHEERLLGKFMLYRAEPGAWSDREVRLCQTIASHLASATVRTRARACARLARAARDDHAHSRRGNHRAERLERDRLRERRGGADDRLCRRERLPLDAARRGARAVRDAERGRHTTRRRRSAGPARAPR